ncbi:hypothetical protein ACLOJK_017486 [Asimina triloba]
MLVPVLGGWGSTYQQDEPTSTIHTIQLLGKYCSERLWRRKVVFVGVGGQQLSSNKLRVGISRISAVDVEPHLLRLYPLVGSFHKRAAKTKLSFLLPRVTTAAEKMCRTCFRGRVVATWRSADVAGPSFLFGDGPHSIFHWPEMKSARLRDAGCDALSPLGCPTRFNVC